VIVASLPADLAAALVAAAPRLGAFGAPDRVRYLETIGSTNDAALAAAASGAAEGTAIIADEQTTGRGRRGRTWSSPPGAGLYMSVVLRGAHLLTAPGRVTLGAGVAAARGIERATGLPMRVKWPNDLVIGAPWRKAGGILCEAQGLETLVVGIGINVTPAAHPADVRARATDIESELGRAAERWQIAVETLAALHALAAQLREAPDSVIPDWRETAADGWEGAEVSWVDGERTVHAIARGVDDAGALLVERDGRPDRVVAGEVTWRTRT
jgi:BirA family biotin operon repressor/biotin-[acetyl-CoA-carboxylase] ligase